MYVVLKVQEDDGCGRKRRTTAWEDIGGKLTQEKDGFFIKTRREENIEITKVLANDWCLLLMSTVEELGKKKGREKLRKKGHSEP